MPIDSSFSNTLSARRTDPHNLNIQHIASDPERNEYCLVYLLLVLLLFSCCCSALQIFFKLIFTIMHGSLITYMR